MATNTTALPVWKKAAFGLVFLALLFGIAELGLAVLGVKPVLQSTDPYVGFVGKLKLFEERASAGGHPELTTAPNKLTLFNQQSFPREKAADTYRIFCLGGSTTYGRPYDDRTSFCGWLREYLQLADPSKNWEVINAGGISYASYRVAILMEELVNYSPDLFIIYTGQNEFLERRTYGDIQDTAAWVRNLTVLLSKTRVYSAIRATVDNARAQAGKADAQESTSSEPEASLLPAEVRTILDGSVGPRDYTRDDELQANVIEHYRFNLNRMVDIANASGAEVLFVQPASNLANCSPFKSEFDAGLGLADRERWTAAMHRAQALSNAGDSAAALEAIEEAVAVDPQRADSHYLRGQLLRTFGRLDEAREAFELARDEDVCPLRALSSMAIELETVASNRHVPLVDFAALVDAASPDALPGEELFLDHVHPTIEGHRLLGETLTEHLISRGVAKPGTNWTPAHRIEVDTRILDGIDQSEHAAALRNLSKVLQWAGKFEEAERLAARAIAMAPNDAAALLQLGLAKQVAGAYDEAIGYVEQAISIEPKSAQLQNALGSMLLDAGRYPEAVTALERSLAEQPDSPSALNNLGLAYQQLGRIADAVKAYERVHDIDPTDAKSWNNQGSAEMTQGNLELAVEHYRRALELSANYSTARYGLGVALGQLRRNAESIAVFEELLRQQPDHADGHYAVGILYLRLNEPSRAREHFEAAVAAQPGHPGATSRLEEMD